MASKRMVFIGMIVGSTIGGWVPTLWHASWLSISSVVLSAVGGLLGIWAAWEIGRRF